MKSIDCRGYVYRWQPGKRFCIRNVSDINTLRPGQNGCLFADDIFKRIFFNENVWISITISLKFVPKDPINNIPTFVQIMAWRRPGDKPLSEPMGVGSLTHVCVTRLQLVKCIFEIRYSHTKLKKCWHSHFLMLLLCYEYPFNQKTLLIVMALRETEIN